MLAIPFSQMEKQYWLTSNQPMMVVVRDQQQWRELLEKLRDSQYTTVEPPPEEFFRERMIIAVFQGWKRSGGYAIRVTSVVEGSDKMKVEVEEVEPGQGCIVSAAVTTPCDIIETKRTEKAVIFEVRYRKDDCKQ